MIHSLTKKLPFRLWSFILGFTLICCLLNAQTPVQKNGQLKVCDTKLCNQYGNPIQLRGMSSHGIQWYESCLTDASLDVLANDWGSDLLRIAMYVQEDGYETDPAGFTTRVHNLIEKATARGMYVVVDWHQLSPGDPNYNLERAKTFFTNIATRHKDKVNIIYDIANEPNEVSWASIKNYADKIIPVIRAIDSDAIILCGTHAWASLGISDGGSTQDILDNPITATNFMYTFHFYAASHDDEYLNELDYASDKLPIFVTEFGTQTASGDGTNNFTMSQKYIDLMLTKKISWANWNYSDDSRSGAVWKSGACPNGPWTDANLKPAGVWIKDKMLNPADDFPGNAGTVPVAPSNLTASAVSNSQINLTWADNANNENLFRIERSPTGTNSWVLVTTTNANITSYANTGLTASTTYFYRVRSENLVTGASTYSNISSATTTGTPSNNLALNKPATASSLETASLVASNAVDGNASTRWASAYSDPQWIYVDLGATYNVTRVKITWEAAYASAYQIQVSTNASTWTTIRTVTGNTTLVNDQTGLSGSGRYVRIYGTTRATAWGYSIFELEVYGTTACTVTAQPGAITGNTNVTAGSSQTYSVATVSGATSYTWTLPTGWSGSSTTNSITTTAGSASGTISVTANNTCGSSAARTLNVTVGTSTANLALNKPATTSSIEGAGFEGSKAVDGSTSSRWASAEGVDPQWIYVDLGATYNVTRVKITWEAAYASAYQVQISANATSWTTLKSVTGNTSLVNDQTGLSGSGRYVRINGTARGTAWGYSIFELEVYGTAVSALRNETASIEKSVTTYPNPASNTVTIQVGDYWQNGSVIALYNAHGVSILTEKISGAEHTFDLSNLPKGMYIIHLSHSTARSTHKIFKQ